MPARSRIGPASVALGVLAALACALTALALSAIGGEVPYLGAVLAFGRPIVLALAVCGCGVAVAALVRGPRRLVPAILAVLLLACGGTSIAASSGVTPALSTGDALRVLEWNTGGDADAAIAAVRASEPDIAVFPELYAGNLAPRSASLSGYTVLGGGDAAVAVLVSERFGDYVVTATGPAPAYAGIIVEPRDAMSDSPRIVGVHLTRTLWPSLAHLWADGLDWVSESCDDANTIAIGDFNGGEPTVRRLGTCGTGGTWAQIAQPATWPADAPAFLGAAIDRVVPAEGWVLESVETVTAPWGQGSDHRPVIAVLRPA